MTPGTFAKVQAARRRADRRQAKANKAEKKAARKAIVSWEEKPK
jgi:hypothetical protein